MKRQYKLSPSIFAANIANLKEQIEILESNNIELLHVDVMDGHFVDRMAFGADHIKMIKEMTSIPLDVHLMIEEPEKHLDSIIKAGADIITIHQESTTRLYSCLQKINKANIKSGVVLSPGTSAQTIENVIDLVDMVLIMTVNPGEGGQSFLPDMLAKIEKVKKMVGDKNIDIEVDGGIDNKNIDLCSKAGANVFVSGGYLFNGDMGEKIKALREKLL
ncbi:ribulose-phosphate 3-epimerase [Intestinibacter sp.]|uniref:ribulose-phosphate 3-epimerase n=1 Tax=Intestinibacter sp. TaxID=1965304 RepID=UPI003F18EEE8